MKLNPELVGKAVGGLGAVLDAAVSLLPEKWAKKVREGRKAVVTLAGGLLSLGLAPEMFPPSLAPWVMGAGIVATAIVTWWTPNQEQA